MTGPGFSAEWDDQFAAGRHHSLWPWSDVVGLVMRNVKKKGGMRVLELGCGVGANIAFFSGIGADYFAVEGSAAAVAHVHRRFPAFTDRVVAADFTAPFPFEGPFDIVLDRSSVTHNTTADITRTIAMIYEALSPGGLYIGIDWFSTKHPEAIRGRSVDEHTREGFEDGPFAGVGRVHFSDEAHLRELLAAFALRLLDEKVLRRVIPEESVSLATWNFVAVKP